MKVTMMLADVVRASEGKLDVLGAGWTVLRVVPAPTAIGVILEVPWAQTGQEHTLELVLTAHDGTVLTDDGGDPLASVVAKFVAQRPPGVLLGSPVSIPLALPVPPLPLSYGARYRWVLTIDGKTNPEWELPFSVAASPLEQAS